MADVANRIRELEEQITAVTDTHKNLAGLVEKLAKIQAALMESEFDSFSDRIAGPFSDLATAAEKIEGLLHEMETKCNELRS